MESAKKPSSGEGTGIQRVASAFVRESPAKSVSSPKPRTGRSQAGRGR
jgi:hypothetical protein